MQIPIQNIYYLLCYAWNKLEESEIVDVNEIDSTELIDLFAKVLSNSCSRLLKQGLDRYYVEHEDVIMGIKGKFNFSATIKQNVLPLSKTTCIYDEFDYDILHNQIIKTTIGKLLRTKNLDSSLKDELHKIYLKLPPISEIVIRKSMFNQIRLHRNNYHYDFILKVCQIVSENLFIDESKGNYKFKDFTREEKAMARLFEAFVRNFYKVETDFSVSSDSITWKFESDNTEDLEMLPTMLTDITLQKGYKKIIIDTKYYKEAFQRRYDKQKINSSNLYQIFSYLKNQETDSEITLNCEGILLYPSIQNNFEYSFKYKNHKIRILSINLNQDWQQIRADLLKIVA
ncbi:5-methylcytosine-specific restriction endonuclease system specificity protein McrC [Gaoshiqia sediminis]|uniref:5-methylcytosine-specific restriction endonuclease system specificity protein McrC n=1 Tax=Gaoshiqia sediminis TaxID=2986998 RepID=A0AA41Y2C4_9BACT|nr:5-methylcytosine-specific restriction endonuclease system specificity protein McrC [Gaoshiqia sediminis]MCW0482181.1 5-methylcytosine-specific restriction endonuclease system specificity protein McrC [Gaoshiqia sediminis]